MVSFLRHFRQYLLRAPFTLRTDHGALTWLQQFKEPEGQLARWPEKLIHHPGRKHSNADSLSRYPCRQCGRESHLSVNPILAISSNEITSGYSSQDMRALQLEDKCIGPILKAKETD